MTNNPVGWFEIYVEDMARAKRFYEAVFKVNFTPLETPIPGLEMWAFPLLEGKGASGSLVKMQGVPAGGNSILVYFSCQDCAVEEARVATAGGRVHKSRFSIGPYGFIALVEDSEGNTIGLHSMQ